MVKNLAIAVLVSSLVISAGNCTSEAGSTKHATDRRDSHMPISEHAVYYLEIVTADVQSVAGFYANAYGWQFEPAAPELGNAKVATLPDGSLCGIRAPMHEQEEPIVRTYLRVANIEAAVQRAAQLGATLALEPMEIPGRGTVAVYLLGGIEQGLWQVP